MSKSWRRTSITIFIVLIILAILLFAFSFVNSTPYSGQSIAEDYDIPIGQSMFEGQSIMTTGDPIELPIVSNFGFMAHQLLAFDLKGIFVSLSTGIVPFDFTTVSSEGIDSYGNVKDVSGPGYLTFEGDKLAVKAPDHYVWGYSAPYKVLTKTADGVDVVENGTVIESIPVDQIKDVEFKNDYYNSSTIRSWYNYDASEGSNFTLEKGIVSFSDGRRDITPDEVPKIFGEDVVDYVNVYPTGSPILLYSGNYTEQDGEVYSTTLGSHAEYGDSIRERV